MGHLLGIHLLFSTNHCMLSRGPSPSLHLQQDLPHRIYLIPGTDPCLVQALTLPTASHIRISTNILRLLGEDAKRSLPKHHILQGIIVPLSRHNLLRRNTILDPRHQRKQRIMPGILEARDRVHARAQRAGLVRASKVPGRVDVGGGAGAVLHAGDEEEAVEGVEVDSLGRERAQDVFVEVDA